ncbi:MAG: right-handed parallel beta-helix repeat-containing protein, partial [Methanofollis sp.]|nr:right-handed parallel beta-helix repeat-containing protein [Methanofollis sp.]
MNTIPPSGKKGVVFLVLLTVLIALVLPVAGGEEDAKVPETIAHPVSPVNLTNSTNTTDTTNTTAPALDLALVADPSAGQVPLTVRFSGAAAGLAVDLWTWTVDGVAAAENKSIFTHTFLEPGTHTVGLTAVNESASVTNTTAVEVVAEANITAAPTQTTPPAVVMADPPPGTHPRDWYVSLVPGTGNPHAYENVTSLLNITDLGAGDTVHIWGVENHTYEGGIAIDAADVTVKRWEGSPAQPLITNISNTAPTFTVTADNAAFLDLNISGTWLKYDDSRGAGIRAAGDAGAPLERLTVTDCTFTGNRAGGNYTPHLFGGALYAVYVDDLLVEGTAFTDNSAGCCGGGAYVWRCQDATFTDTAFTSNGVLDAEGGGVYFNESRNAVFTGVTFTNNRAGNAGGAFFYDCDNAVFTDVTFAGNSVRGSYGGADFTSCDDITLTNTSFINNKAWSDGGGARFIGCENAILTNTTFTGNTATKWSGGGALFGGCDNLTITNASFTGNSARHGGGANIGGCDNATITATAFTDNRGLFGGGAYIVGCDAAAIVSSLFTNNTASQDGGGACFSECAGVMLANCRLDNPTNIYASESSAVLNTTRTPGTNIAGGPYLGGNLWLRDPEQNISEWGTDADFDGICDQALPINNSESILFGTDEDDNTLFGTDYLPLMYDGDRGTVLLRASGPGGFVYVDGVNTTRPADSFAPRAMAATDGDNAFFLPAGTHTIE